MFPQSKTGNNLKRSLILVGMIGFSFVVAADCAEDCQAKYEECMKMSHSSGKSKICGEILHDCKLDCAGNGE